ncbi:hypothetical protein [Bacillus thuringiensis]|uniref:hypothetical protein n=1 Tax=Bacillus thuringiensis TaxID=1428 RepID=UPI000BFA2319|nr:hypothetical protein [Bacillus thuringiensis]PFU71345.1 hypothetical protein COK95_07830 [Bacillus thuringiensis]
MEDSKTVKKVYTDASTTIKGGDYDSLVIGPIPADEIKYFLFTTYEVKPIMSEVFLVGYDLKGSNSIELTFYNKGTNDVTIKGHYIIRT